MMAMMISTMMATIMLGKDAGGQGAAAEGRWPLPSYVYDLPTSHLLAAMMIVEMF